MRDVMRRAEEIERIRNGSSGARGKGGGRTGGEKRGRNGEFETVERRGISEVNVFEGRKACSPEPICSLLPES